MPAVPPVLPYEPMRRTGLDLLRIGATFLVILLHAGVPYTIAPMPGLTWPVRHSATSPTVDLIFWGIEGAIMPLFLMLSGYGAAQSLASRADRFLASRWRRLGWPLLGAASVLLPVELYVWLIGWAADGEIPFRKLQSLSLGRYHQDLWGLSHLWYLEYLLLYSVMFWAAMRWRTRCQQNPERWASRATEKFVSLTMNPPGLFCGSVLVLWMAPEVIVGFQHSFVPVPAKFVFSGLFFAAGVVEFHRPQRSDWSVTTMIMLASWIFISELPLIHGQAEAPLQGPARLVLSMCMSAFAWLMVRAGWKWGMTHNPPVHRWVTWLAGASFWTYLVHHPLVAIWQIGLRPSGWTAWSQFVVCSLGTIVLSLASYEVLVRRTWVGRLLNGQPLRMNAQKLEPSAPAAVCRAA